MTVIKLVAKREEPAGMTPLAEILILSSG